MLFCIKANGAISISFCTLHLLVAYYFAWHFIKNLKRLPLTNAVKFAKWAVYWMVISTVGLWGNSTDKHIARKGTSAVFWPLFSSFCIYNLMAGLPSAFWLYFLNSRKILVSKYNPPKGTFGALQISLLLTYTLSITWSTPEDFLFYLNSSAGVILQIIAFSLLAKGFFNSANLSFIKGRLSRWLLQFGLLSLALKVIVQGACSPAFYC